MQFRWGNVVLHLAAEGDFSQGFAFGRRLYVEDCLFLHPERATTLYSVDILEQIARDQGEGWLFGEDVQENPVLHLGVLVGYLSGPLQPETDEERHVRIGGGNPHE